MVKFYDKITMTDEPFPKKPICYRSVEEQMIEFL